MKRFLMFLRKIFPVAIFICALFAFSLKANAGFIANAGDAVLRGALELAGIDTNATCETPQVDKTHCLFCPMFKAIFNACSLMAGVSYNMFADPLATLLLVFLAVSLALIILKNLASMGAKDASSIMNDVIKKTFLVVVIYLIIKHNYYAVLNITIVPVFEIAMNFIGVTYDGGTVETGCSHATGLIGVSGAMSGGSKGGIPLNIGKMIVCGVQEIETKINMLFEYGEWALCRGFGPDKLFYILPRIICIVDGIILYISGIFFMVAYPWVMADAVFQLGLAMTLLPFAITGYAFGGTKAYLSKVWNWILNSIFVFLFSAILVACILGYIGTVLLNATNSVSPEDVFLDANNGLAFWGPNMILIIFILAIGWTYMPTIANLAGNFANGSSVTAASKLGGAITDKMEDAGKKIGNKAGDVAMAAGRATLAGTRNLTRNAARVGTAGIVNRLGTPHGTGKRMKFMGMTFETDVEASTGKTVLKRSWTNPLNGRTHTRIYDRYATIKQVKTKSGVEIRNEVKFRHDFVKEHMLDANGDINADALNSVLNSPLALKDPKYKEALMSEIAVLSMRKKGLEVGDYYKSRNVTFDANDPSKIFIEQVDFNGKITRFGMNIDMTTGRVALTHEVERATNQNKINQTVRQMGRNTKKVSIFGNETETLVDADGNDYYVTRRKRFIFFGKKIETVYAANSKDVFFSNGMVDMTISKDKKGIETTTYKYSARAMKGHRDFRDTIEEGKVVESSGKIAEEFDPSSANYIPGMDLMYGIDELSKVGINAPLGSNMKDHMIGAIFAAGATLKTNKMRTTLL